MSCYNLLALVFQWCSNSQVQGCIFSQVQRIHRTLASCSFLTCWNEFKYTFSDSPVPNKTIVFCLVTRFVRPSVLRDDSLDDIRQIFITLSTNVTKRLSLHSVLSYSSVHKATKILKIHSCHAQTEGSLVVAFLEIYGPFYPRIFRHWISVFVRTCTKTTRTHQKN